MLSKRRCTATGVINFYARQDPHLAVGSIVPRAVVPPVSKVLYVWHYHGASAAAAGTASDWQSAEIAINEQHRQARVADVCERFAA